MKIKSLLIVAMLNMVLSFHVCAQDIVLTISGELKGAKTSLDSISLENRTNGTKIGFGRLPERSSYQINLNKMTFIEGSSVDRYGIQRGFYMKKNQPGLISIGFEGTPASKGTLEVFSINGQKVFTTDQLNLNNGQTFDLILGQYGVFIVKATTGGKTQSFKANGIANGNTIRLQTADNSQNAFLEKSTSNDSTNFSFNIGDSLVVNAYKKNYFTPCQYTEIKGNESLLFDFSIVEYVDIKGGTFMMGQEYGESDERPVHSVSLASFQISKYEVTQGQFIEFLNAIKCNSDGTFNDAQFGKVSYFNKSDINSTVGYSNGLFVFNGNKIIPTIDCPAAFVTWHGANAFCKWVGGRLPTEAEWEYAARDGENNSSFSYSGSNSINEVAWYYLNCNEVNPVGRKKPNMIGLYDMSGNVSEWCADWYSSSYYKNSPPLNPQGPTSGTSRVFRGGNIKDTQSKVNIFYRRAIGPTVSDYGLGFRVVHDYNQPRKPVATTKPATEITKSSVKLNGIFVSDGKSPVTERGFFWSKTNPNPGVNDSKIIDQGSEPEYHYILNNLEPDVTYYYVAYAINAKGIGKGAAQKFMVISRPVVATNEATTISEVSATLQGTVSYDGGAPITQRGFYWSETNINPGIADSIAVVSGSTGNFSKQLTNLKHNTTFYYAAYARNSEGMSIGQISSFKTREVVLPSVTTNAVTNLNSTSATLNGRLNVSVLASGYTSGFYWSKTNPDPDETDSVVAISNTSIQFTKTLVGLEPNTTYYYKAFVMKYKVVSKGAVASFTTLSAPQIKSLPATNVTETFATLNAVVLFNGKSPITERGFYWSASNPHPGEKDTKVPVAATADTFSVVINKLKPDSMVYYVPYAKNSIGTSFGEVQSFRAKTYLTGTMVDARDGKTYKTIKIGKQWWMAENLAYLPKVSTVDYGSDISRFYYVHGYNDTIVSAAKNTANYATYGALYNWTAAVDSSGSSNLNPSGIKGVCPEKWHLPSNSEWLEMVNYLIANGYNYDGSKTGNKLAKALAADTLWTTSNVAGSPGKDMAANNASGFSSLPAGHVAAVFGGYFSSLRREALYWTSTVTTSYRAWGHIINYDSAIPESEGNYLAGGAFSVRCVRDTKPIVKTKAVSNLKENAVTVNAEIAYEGLTTVTEKGFYWSETNKTPTENDQKVVVTDTAWAFNATISGLKANTLYYFIPYAMNSEGVGLGSVTSVTTLSKPTVTTNAATQIGESAVSLSGEITFAGRTSILERGFYWSKTNPTPGENDNVCSEKVIYGDFIFHIDNLEANTDYYFRAYAKNSEGIGTGSVQSFKTKAAGSGNTVGILADSRDGNRYRTLKLGNQWWMAENLAYLPSVYPPTEFSDTLKYYHVYKYTGTNVEEAKASEKYKTAGVLYNWSAAMDLAGSSTANPSGVSGVCPSGWHMPSDTEWIELENYMIANGFNHDKSLTGNKIAKALADNVYWRTSTTQTGAVGNETTKNNKSGFSAVPGGKVINGEFADEYKVYWWTTTEKDSQYVHHRSLDYSSTGLTKNYTKKTTSQNVRCVKD